MSCCVEEGAAEACLRNPFLRRIARARSARARTGARAARLVKADLSGANLFGVEFYKAVVGETDFDRANLKMTLLHKRAELLDDQK